MVSSRSISTVFALILLLVGSHAASTRRLKQDMDPLPTAEAFASVSLMETPVSLPSPSISISVVTSTTPSPPADPTPSPATPADPMPADPPADPTPSPATPADPMPADPPADATPSPATPADPMPADPPADATPSPATPADPMPADPPVPASPVDPVMSPTMPPPMCRPELCEAAVRRDESVVRSAIEAGEAGLCDCVCDATTGDTLLHVSACSEAVAFAGLLLNPPSMCDVDVMDADGGSPLHEAAGCCNQIMTFNFLDFGADTEKLNDAMRTPLCVVAIQSTENCAPLVVQLVSDFNANVCAPCPTPSGPMLPVDVAVNPVIKDVIIQNGGNPVALGGTC